jgi:hypothetical protein
LSVLEPEKWEDVLGAVSETRSRGGTLKDEQTVATEQSQSHALDIATFLGKMRQSELGIIGAVLALLNAPSRKSSPRCCAKFLLDSLYETITWPPDEAVCSDCLAELEAYPTDRVEAPLLQIRHFNLSLNDWFYLGTRSVNHIVSSMSYGNWNIGLT